MDLSHPGKMLPPAIRHTLGLVLLGYRDLVSATACERVSDYVTVLIKREDFVLGEPREPFWRNRHPKWASAGV